MDDIFFVPGHFFSVYAYVNIYIYKHALESNVK